MNRLDEFTRQIIYFNVWSLNINDVNSELYDKFNYYVINDDTGKIRRSFFIIKNKTKNGRKKYIKNYLIDEY